MSGPVAPKLEPRRAAQFYAELRERARAWIPAWGFDDTEGDFGGALLQIAARFNSEVAERLDRAGEKMRRGFLDWLAVSRGAARPSRMPVVFKLTDTANEPVLARFPVQMQAPAGDASVVFETEKDINILPGSLQTVVAVDGDKFYLPPPGLSDLEPLKALPTEWQLKSFAAAEATKLQLEPEAGLEPGMIVTVGGTQYTIVTTGNGIATIDPPLVANLATPAAIRKVSTFAPFESGVHNAQEHVLYLGHMDVLNIDAEATIDVVGATQLASGVEWAFWGTVDDTDDPRWVEIDTVGAAANPARVVLHKPKGKVVPREINEVKSRWIRAYATSVDPAQPPFSVDSVTLRVNCIDTTTPGKKVDPVDVSGTAEAMDNTTPIVLNSVFFPLGKIPRQFDSFYLGSPEAFSKVGATVQLKFTMAEATFFALSAVREGPFADRMLAGVGADAALHLFSFEPSNGTVSNFQLRDPLRPPSPGFAGKTPEGAGVALDSEPSWRLPMWFEPGATTGSGRLAVGVTAGDDIWIWFEHETDPKQSGWMPYGSIKDPSVTSPTPIAGLVFLAAPPAPQLFALRDQQLWVSDWPNGPNWTKLATRDAGPVKLEQIAPVFVPAPSPPAPPGQFVTSANDGMVAVSDDGTLYAVDPLVPASIGNCTAISGLENFRIDLQPVAISDAAGVVAASVEDTDPPSLTAFHSTAGSNTTPFAANVRAVGSLDAAVVGGQAHLFATVESGGASRLATWAPFAPAGEDAEFETAITSTGGRPVNSPTFIGAHVVVAGKQGDLHVSAFDLLGRHFESASLDVAGIVVPASIPAIGVGDTVLGQPGQHQAVLMQTGVPKDSEVFYRIDTPFPTGTTDIDAYIATTAFPNGTVSGGGTTLQFDLNDHSTTIDPVLVVGGELCTTTPINPTPSPLAVTITTVSGAVLPDVNTAYIRPTHTGGRVAPFMELVPPANGNWDAKLLDTAPLVISGLAQLEIKRGKAFTLGLGNHPALVVLDSQVQTLPASNPVTVTYVLDNAVGGWTQLLGDTSSNPELSWEYSNGRSWGKLASVSDDTQNLKRSGIVQFKVPTDLAQSDWAGKSDFWIRARLIGGDYGQETVTVISKPQPDGSTKQTVERSTEGIRAPSVVRLEIFYSICTEVLPEAVLAQDSGTTLDQTAANRTRGAFIEGFVPLPLALLRLSNAPPSTADATNCPPGCFCRSCLSAATTKSKTTASKAADASSTTQTAASTQRALFIGLKTVASGGPVNILLLVDEAEHSQFTPLNVEALIENEFQPITASDATRAIGESGLLTLSFELVPTEAELFGQSLTWLRLTPRGGDLSKWKPSIRGAYLNGMWASATETLTRELVGSSEGAPNLKLTLARPPLLEKTLELRVNEPLGEEDVKQLVEEDKNLVKIDPDQLKGHWVLWTQVIDPLDYGPRDRVYSLDESSGEIQFGDGLHGMIPPIGTDSIVAFRYQRTEPAQPGSDAIPGNEVEPRTVLGLVSPLPTVETVTAADQSAGGTLPDKDDRVVQFGFARLRHRERAVTAADIEDLILAMSPDIAQARCLLKRGSARVVVVKRGANPTPSNAELREWTRELLTQVPSSLSTSNAVSVVKPKLRALRIYMKVVVDSLDNAGAFSADAKAAIVSLLDPSTGSAPKAGWLLGASPSEDDIALSLIDTAHLESIVEVKFYEVTPDGTEGPWPSTLLSTELAVLDDDPVRIQFELVGAGAGAAV
ncbi:MAG TPA: hypothetical protein VGP95_11125 [Gemmatimonadaceae bacterium]|jgi:hypothetical protein|nr:hypothetical protein [Gemmatimonadaceae bacterium]